MKKYSKLKMVVLNYTQDVVTNSDTRYVDCGLFIEDSWSES